MGHMWYKQLEDIISFYDCDINETDIQREYRLSEANDRYCKSVDNKILVMKELKKNKKIKEEKEIAEFDTDNLDTALYQDNCDWSFDKPINKPYHTIYIFDKEEE